MAATGLIQGINPYEVGNVPLDFSSKPTQLAIENIQRQHAQADATQKYFREYEKQLNPAGLSKDDIDEFNKTMLDAKSYGMKNMQNINNPQNDGYEAYSTLQQKFKNAQSLIDLGKQKTANLKNTNDFIEQVKRSGKHLSPNFMDMYKAATLPVTNEKYQAFNPALVDVYDQFNLPKESKDVFSKVDLNKTPGWTPNPLNKDERAPTETTTFNPANAPKLYEESASIMNKNPYGVKDFLESLTPTDKSNLAKIYQTELEPHIYGAKDNAGNPYSGKVDAAGKPIPYVSKGDPTATELLTAALYRNAPRNTQITGKYELTSEAKKRNTIDTELAVAYEKANIEDKKEIQSQSGSLKSLVDQAFKDTIKVKNPYNNNQIEEVGIVPLTNTQNIFKVPTVITTINQGIPTSYPANKPAESVFVTKDGKFFAGIPKINQSTAKPTGDYDYKKIAPEAMATVAVSPTTTAKNRKLAENAALMGHTITVDPGTNQKDEKGNPIHWEIPAINFEKLRKQYPNAQIIR